MSQVARPSLALLTDLYQLSMASAYWKTGRAERRAAFHLFFRRHPFGGAYAVCSGLADAIDYLRQLQFTPEDLSYLAQLNGADGKPLFEPAFLDYLENLTFRCHVDAIREGTVVFAHEPLMRLEGPILQCQLVETALLNMINFQTLIATKAARICRSAQGEPVLEFGLRRAQGIDGAISASRAAYVGGCAATSNVLAGQRFGIPVKGTHAHSWVMSYEDELESFQAYADALPNNCVFLVDTFDTLQGVAKAIEVGQRIRQEGHEMVGIRLDSGDLNELSQQARKMLDEAGFEAAAIVASNDLDEFEIEQLKKNGAKISVWGVGTRLATAYDQPALGGVYKLAAIEDDDKQWSYRVKLSEEPIKVSNPGIQQVRRFVANGRFHADCIYDLELGLPEPATLMDMESGEPLAVPSNLEYEDLLVPIFRDGQVCYETPSLSDIRDRTLQQLQRLPDVHQQLRQPQPFSVGLEQRLHDRKLELMSQAKQGDQS